MATAATIGRIIPPSMTMIVYGAMTGVSIGGLFLAGVISGILLGLMMTTMRILAGLPRYPELRKVDIGPLLVESDFVVCLAAATPEQVLRTTRTWLRLPAHGCAAPERIIWAGDWPHPSLKEPPDEARLLGLLRDWIDDEATLNRVLIENPARLYGFELL